MKRIIALLLWLGGSVAFAQSIQGVNPSASAPDGYNATAAKVISLPQVQPTIVYNISPTPSPVVPQPTQATNWYQMNGNGALAVEFGTNTFSGSYSVQVSNNPTPVATNVTNIYTVVQDSATYASGGQGAQTKDWLYYIREGYKWVRFIAQPDSNNVGTLNIQGRLFGNPTAGDASRTYVSGVPWKQSDILVPSTVVAAAVTNYYDYKLPQSAHGINIYTNITANSGASTITTTVYEKDPTTGQLQAIAVLPATHATGFNSANFNPGYASPYPIATPPAGTNFYSIALGQDIVIGNAFTGTGSSTYSQVVVPIE